MVKCPKCKKEIEYLIQKEEAIACYKFEYNKANKDDKKGGFTYELYDTEPTNSGEIWYVCPECEEEITSDIEKAEKLIKKGVWR